MKFRTRFFSMITLVVLIISLFYCEGNNESIVTRFETKEQKAKRKKNEHTEIINFQILIFALGLGKGGCEAENQNSVSFFPEVGKEMTQELGGVRRFFFRITQNKNIDITYTPIDANCIYTHYGHGFCNGIFQASPKSIKCSNSKQTNFVGESSFIDFTASDGSTTCKIDLANVPVTSATFSIGIDYKSPLKKCKISVLINYE